MSAGVAAKDLDLGPTAAAKSKNRGRFIVGHAATNQLEKGGFTHAGIFEVREGSAGKDRESSGVAARGFENNLIGEACEAHDDGFTAPGSDLIELRELHNGGFGNAGAEQLRDVIADLEFFIAAADQTNQGDAVIIGDAGLTGLGDLRDFGIGDVQAFESLNRGEAHSGVIERRCVQGLEMAASKGEKRSDGQSERKSECLQWRNAKAPAKSGSEGDRKHAQIIVTVPMGDAGERCLK